jgi:mannose-6-phosphate isomerase-like protein (cupin superfamily)
MAKVALASTARAQLDLYCLGPGQAQTPHTHADQDKIYVVLEGRARVVVDGAEETVEPGEAVVAAAGAAHGIANDTPDPLLVLVIVAPPPPHA